MAKVFLRCTEASSNGDKEAWTRNDELRLELKVGGLLLLIYIPVATGQYLIP